MRPSTKREEERTGMNAEQYERIEALYREMFEKLRSYAYAIVKNEFIAEEAVQEAFRIACQYPDKVCGSPNPRGWLMLALRNVLRNIRSRQENADRITEQYLTNRDWKAGFTEDSISLDVLYSNVAHTEEFKLVTEQAIEGRTHEEMARSRNISVNTCKKRIQRAKETLQRRIGK